MTLEPDEAGYPTFVADEVAAAALIKRRRAPLEECRCDACADTIEGAPPASGAHLSMRGSDVRIDAPPLCASCATAIGITALRRNDLDEC
ncbi:MAG: hypothetical protein EXR75_08130 [Myxococcales bacterium]|nr:hypothetical protein [Myxococcales bacterium]